MIYEGYVLVSELYKKCCVSSTLFRPENGYKLENIGGYRIIKKSDIPKKYIKKANECSNLGKYLPARYFTDIIGMDESYFYRFLNKIATKKLTHVRLIELNDDFIKHIKNKKTPCWISAREKNTDDFDDVIDFYGIKIGFY